jgi:hypothetical protein
MFGLSDNNNNNQYTDTTQMSASQTAPDNSHQGGAGLPAPGTLSPTAGYPSAMPPVSATSQAAPGNPTATASTSGGISDVSLENAYIDSGQPSDKSQAASNPVQPTAASLVHGSNEDELLKLKQQALQSLAPLVDHLDQDPEAKFKTTMMMIQASDNADLIPEAYEAANKITDEKIRAQALLDVVNEINYFTQQTSQGSK